MSLNVLNSTDFYSYSELSSADVNTNYVDFLIEQLNALIDAALEQVFSFNDLEADCYRDNSGSSIIVGTWQPPNRVVEVTITNGGNSYVQSTTTVTFSGGTPKVQAKGEATVEAGVITKITITSPGDGYQSVPTITIGGDGSGAAATATLSTLTVELGQDNGTLTELTVAEDFRFLFIGERRNPTRTQPIGAILLYRSRLTVSHFLRLIGTYGANDGIPSETLLESQMYDILKKAVLTSENETEGGGKGVVSRSQIDKVSVTFGALASRGHIWTTKNALEIAQGVVAHVKRSYEYNKNYFNAVIG